MASPCGIALRANNSILVEEIFHGAKVAKEKIGCRVYTLCAERFAPSAESRKQGVGGRKSRTEK